MHLVCLTLKECIFYKELYSLIAKVQISNLSALPRNKVFADKLNLMHL
jgi:hypothetical protein